MEEFACAYTGHRQGSFLFRNDEEHPVCKQLKQLIREEMLRMIGEGVTSFCGGLSVGPDLWVAEAVLALKEEKPSLKLTIVLPTDLESERFPRQHSERCDQVLCRCDKHFATQHYDLRGCVAYRDRYLVSIARRLLVIQGRKPQGRGFSPMVQYAVDQGREITLIRADTMRAGPLLQQDG